MEYNNTLFLVSFVHIILLINSIPVSLSQNTNQYVSSSNPPILIPRLETWARAMQLSFRSISEPPIQSQLPSHSSRIVSINPYQKRTKNDQSDPIQSQLPALLQSNAESTVYPFLDGNSDVLEKTMKSIGWLIKLGSIQAQKLSNTLGNPKDETRILKICKDSYDNASTNLQEAMKALSSKNAKRMNSMLNAVLSDVGDCRDEYLDKPSPLASYDDEVTKMTNNCLVVLNLVGENR